MPDTTRDATAPRQRGVVHETVRRHDVRGLLESTRQWARERGLAVPTHGPVPPGLVAQYRRRQTWE